MGGSGKRMGDLVYKSEPSFYVRYFGRCEVTANRVMVLCAWTDVGRGFQSQLSRFCREIRLCHSTVSEHILVWVKANTISPTDVEPVHCLMEAISQVIVDDLGLVRHVRYYLVEVSGVPIAGCNIAVLPL